jgi:hypothetical protein
MLMALAPGPLWGCFALGLLGERNRLLRVCDLGGGLAVIYASIRRLTLARRMTSTARCDAYCHAWSGWAWRQGINTGLVALARLQPGPLRLFKRGDHIRGNRISRRIDGRAVPHHDRVVPRGRTFRD